MVNKLLQINNLDDRPPWRHDFPETSPRQMAVRKATAGHVGCKPCPQSTRRQLSFARDVSDSGRSPNAIRWRSKRFELSRPSAAQAKTSMALKPPRRMSRTQAYLEISAADGTAWQARCSPSRHLCAGIAVPCDLAIRILIADDHEVVREGLRRCLESQPGWEVVAEATDGRDAVGKALETKPNVAVLDYSMPRMNGVDATRQIRTRLRDTEVLIFTICDDNKIMSDCLDAGARGYVLKTDAQDDLVRAVEALGAHKPFFTAMLSEQLLARFVTLPMGKAPVLNDRERDIVQLIAQGHTSRQIASVLNVSYSRVETERAILNRKLDAPTSAGIVRYAIRNGLIEP